MKIISMHNYFSLYYVSNMPIIHLSLYLAIYLSCKYLSNLSFYLFNTYLSIAQIISLQANYLPTQALLSDFDKPCLSLNVNMP